MWRRIQLNRRGESLGFTGWTLGGILCPSSQIVRKQFAYLTLTFDTASEFLEVNEAVNASEAVGLLVPVRLSGLNIDYFEIGIFLYLNPVNQSGHVTRL